MTINRDNLIDKIRALLSKTQGNGCTEHEALAALDKARAMMDAYEVTEEDLRLSKAESAILSENNTSDKHAIRRNMACSISKFCDCKVWKRGDGAIVFCGLPSDAQFATWLMDSLAGFVQGELANYLLGCMAPKGQRRLIINGFVLGCASRISQRLDALCQQSTTVATSNGRALVLVKGTAIADKMKELGVTLGRGRRSSRRTDGSSYAAGQSAGERASFGRPVSGSSGALRLS